MKYHTHCKICGKKLEFYEDGYIGVCLECENKSKDDVKNENIYNDKNEIIGVRTTFRSINMLAGDEIIIPISIISKEKETQKENEFKEDDN